jgi:lysophospholipase L1-like esterase
MRGQSARFVWLGLICGALAGSLACSQAAGTAGRTAAERENLIKPGNFGENGAADRRRVFFDFWNEEIIREDRPVSTVFMGDSITEFWDLPAYFPMRPEAAIENRGISGDLATVMAKRFAADVIQLRPRNVVILAGTNDVANLSSQGKSHDEIYNTTVSAIESMVDQAQKAGIRVLVCSILPTNGDYKMHHINPGLRRMINAGLKTLCTEQKCIYVDYAAALQDGTGELRKDLARDGLHPHWAGYEVMARVLKEAAQANGLRL